MSVVSDKKLVLVGGGGHSKSVLDSVRRMNEYSEIVITDPAIKQGTLICGCQVIGTDDILPLIRLQGFLYAFISVGSIDDVSLRKQLARHLDELGFIFPVIKDPSSNISETAILEEGAFIGKNAILNAGVKIGKHCIINSGAIVEHECLVGDYTHISVGAIMCGGSKVGSDSFIGAGSTIMQGVSVGDESIIGANSLVLSDVPGKLKSYGIINYRVRR